MYHFTDTLSFVRFERSSSVVFQAVIQKHEILSRQRTMKIKEKKVTFLSLAILCRSTISFSRPIADNEARKQTVRHCLPVRSQDLSEVPLTRNVHIFTSSISRQPTRKSILTNTS